MKVVLVQPSYDDARFAALSADGGATGLVSVRRDALLELAERAIETERPDLVVLPELWGPGAFSPRTWADAAETLDGPTCTALAELAHRTGTVVHGGSLIEAESGHEREVAQAGEPVGESAGQRRLFNTQVVFGPDGAQLAIYRKRHLFRAGGVEADLLTPGEEAVTVDVPLRSGGTARLGLATCYDLRFPELFRVLARHEPELLVIPAAWPQARALAWEALLPARAIENQAFVLGCAVAGVDRRTALAGGSGVWGPEGAAVARAGSETSTLVADLDLDEVQRLRRDFPVADDRVITQV